MFKKRRRRRARTSFIQRLFRSVVSIIVLTTFVLGISLSVKQLAHLNPDKAAQISEPLLNKIGVSPEKAGDVAGAFVERMLKTKIEPSENYKESLENGPTANVGTTSTTEPGQVVNKELVLKVALIADSHDNDENLKKALNLIKQNDIKTVFFLGDYTDFGDVEHLTKAKNIMDASGLVYYSLPGDHDLAQTVGPANYYQVFTKPQTLVTINGIKFVTLDNSANYTPIDSEDMRQFELALPDASFVLLSQPIYYPFVSISKPVMGYVNGETIPDMKEQANNILGMIRKSSVKAVIAADHHSFSRNPDPVNENLEHIVIGSVTDARAEQSKTSATFLSIFSDGSYKVEESLFE
jgi:hypothetical protein